MLTNIYNRLKDLDPPYIKIIKTRIRAENFTQMASIEFIGN